MSEKYKNLKVKDLQGNVVLANGNLIPKQACAHHCYLLHYE